MLQGMLVLLVVLCVTTSCIYSFLSHLPTSIKTKVSFQRFQSIDSNNNNDSNDIDNDQTGRPPIIPFDESKNSKPQPNPTIIKRTTKNELIDEFARNDVPLKPIEQIQKQFSKTVASVNQYKDQLKAQSQGVELPAPPSSRRKRINDISNIDRDEQGNLNTNPDSMRPTGYDNDEYDPDDEPNYPANYITPVDTGEPKNEVLEYLKEVYIGSPYDSKNKKQARYVVRNITGISLAIGLIFTIIWYAFPGKFISFREDKDFTSRYPSVYIDPDNLLKTEANSYNGGMTLFDDPLGSAGSSSPGFTRSSSGGVTGSGTSGVTGSGTSGVTGSSDVQDTESRLNRGSNNEDNELIINREVQRFKPTPKDIDKYYAKPTIEL